MGTILDFIFKNLTFGQAAGFLLICALIYIWYQHHLIKILKEKSRLDKIKRKEVLEEFKKVSNQELEPRQTFSEKKDEVSQKILIADDEEMMLDFMTRAIQLKRRDIFLTTVRNGEELFQQITQNRPSLIIIDLMLPGKTGFEVLKELAYHRQALPTLIISGYFRSKNEIPKIELIDNEKMLFLSKPFSPQQLLDAIEKLLN